MANIIKEYPNKDITIVWKPDLCIHAAECVKGLPAVFNPDKRPWIDIAAADSDSLVETIDKCPSGALMYRKNARHKVEELLDNLPAKASVLKNGPLILDGSFELFGSDGNKLEIKSKIALCRCGASKKQPFCDGTHLKIDFIG